MSSTFLTDPFTNFFPFETVCNIFLYVFQRVTFGTPKKKSRTVGACVWTAEDLKKDPSAWEHREATLLGGNGHFNG